MKRRSLREKALIGICVLVVLVMGGPALQQFLPKRGPTAAASERRLRAAQTAREADATALAALDAHLQRLAARQPPITLAAAAAEELNRRAAAAGVHLREVKPLPSRPLQAATAVPLQLMFAAPFPRAARFLTDLRAHPNRLAVDRAVIASSSANSDQVSVNLRVLVFSLNEEKQEKARGKS